IVSNQVIEHLINTDTFCEMIFRILKKGGYSIIATENISYYANIFALLLGYQAFSQNISDRFHVGNPLSSFSGKEFTDKFSTHKRIFSIRGLPAFLEKYGFKIEAVLGAGFAPLPSFFSRINKIHSRFIIVKARKL
ncbi:MAG: class I SAM-dependent methyltransferase, partial [Nitrospirota bacterium]